MLTKRSILDLERATDRRCVPLRRLYNKQLSGGGSDYSEDLGHGMENLSLNEGQEFLVADSMLHTGQETISVIPFHGIALPLPDETSEAYGRRLHAYNFEQMQRSTPPHQFAMIQRMMDLRPHGLRNMWEERSINDFAEVRTVRLFSGDQVSRNHMPRDMAGWRWTNDPAYNGEGWIPIGDVDGYAMQNSVQDGVRGFGAFALLLR